MENFRWCVWQTGNTEIRLTFDIVSEDFVFAYLCRVELGELLDFLDIDPSEGILFDSDVKLEVVIIFDGNL